MRQDLGDFIRGTTTVPLPPTNMSIIDFEVIFCQKLLLILEIVGGMSLDFVYFENIVYQKYHFGHYVIFHIFLKLFLV